MGITVQGNQSKDGMMRGVGVFVAGMLHWNRGKYFFHEHLCQVYPFLFCSWMLISNAPHFYCPAIPFITLCISHVLDMFVDAKPTKQVEGGRAESHWYMWYKRSTHALKSRLMGVDSQGVVGTFGKERLMRWAIYLMRINMPTFCPILHPSTLVKPVRMQFPSVMFLVMFPV